MVLEEVIDGQEYQVNGQVDAAGQPTVTAAYQTNRRPVGQRSNMASDFWTLPGTDPRFTALSDYAAEVMGTSAWPARRSTWSSNSTMRARA